MFTFFMIVEILVSVILMIAVLMQSSKGGGLAGSFGGANIGTVFGVRRTSDFLTKTTTVLATLFIVLALFINLFLLPRGEGSQQSIIQSAIPASGSMPPSSLPQQQPTQTPK